MQGLEAFRLRVGDYRVIYQFDSQKNELYLIAMSTRRRSTEPIIFPPTALRERELCSSL